MQTLVALLLQERETLKGVEGSINLVLAADLTCGFGESGGGGWGWGGGGHTREGREEWCWSPHKSRGFRLVTWITLPVESLAWTYPKLSCDFEFHYTQANV